MILTRIQKQETGNPGKFCSKERKLEVDLRSFWNPTVAIYGLYVVVTCEYGEGNRESRSSVSWNKEALTIFGYQED